MMDVSQFLYADTPYFLPCLTPLLEIDAAADGQKDINQVGVPRWSINKFMAAASTIKMKSNRKC